MLLQNTRIVGWIESSNWHHGLSLSKSLQNMCMYLNPYSPSASTSGQMMLDMIRINLASFLYESWILKAKIALVLQVAVPEIVP